MLELSQRQLTTDQEAYYKYLSRSISFQLIRATKDYSGASFGTVKFSSHHFQAIFRGPYKLPARFYTVLDFKFREIVSFSLQV